MKVNPWTQHLYSYAGNSPTSFVDPTGHFFAPPKLIDGDRGIRPVYKPRKYADTGTGSRSSRKTSKHVSGVGSAVSSTITNTDSTSNVTTFNSDKEIEYDSQSLPGPKEGGEPNSVGVVRNPDGTLKRKRIYGPNGEPQYDVDYNHNHPGGVDFPHGHVWGEEGRSREHTPLD